MTSATLTITLLSGVSTATLRYDTDGRWRWFDVLGGSDHGLDMEISGATAEQALDALIDAYGTLDIDGDMSDHLDAARVLDREG